MLRILAALLLFASLLGSLPCAQAQQSQSLGTDALTKRIDALSSLLDDNRYDVRQRAAADLQTLLADPATGTVVAAQLRRLLQEPDLSFEVRKQLEAWLPKSPAMLEKQPAAPLVASREDLQSLIVQLDDVSYAKRLGASRRLQALARQPSTAIPLSFLLREQLADPQQSRDLYRTLYPLWEAARGTWLLSDPASWQLPEVTDKQIERSVAELIKAPPPEHQGPWHAHSAARRELFDFLARDEVAPRVKRVLERELAKEELDAASRERLDEIHEWTIPALVAEMWKGREHIAIQHLHVDVPRQSAGAPRPSHFSRIDDRTATCVSGSNLVPGEYPVGEAIPHPTGNPEAWRICHLVNLPTPRRRMAYEYAVRVDQQQRLAELTERTFRRAIVGRLHLTDLNIQGFVELDPATVSRMAPLYLMSVDDKPMEPGNYNIGPVRGTHHQRICHVLALLGTKEAGPGLVQVLKERRCHPPSSRTTPYHLPAIAALAIAARDPWPECEAWLASQIRNEEPLVLAGASDDSQHLRPNAAEDDHATINPPRLGPSAAAVLLELHDQSPSSFGLAKVDVAALAALDCPSYRFKDNDAPQRVLDWWQALQRQQSAPRHMP